jgi:pyruvate formate lyase activating enzyme
LNDNDKETDAMSKWLVENVGTEVPVHFTRFYPTYKLANLPPTPVATVERARQIALARGIKYVYVGNVPAKHPGESTYCAKCGDQVIERAGFTILANRLHNGRCLRCNSPVAGVWS